MVLSSSSLLGGSARSSAKFSRMISTSLSPCAGIASHAAKCASSPRLGLTPASAPRSLKPGLPAFPGLGGAERLPPAGVDTSPLAKRRGASATIVRQAVGSDPAGEPALASSSDLGAVGQPSANTKATQPITAVRAALKTILFIFLCFKVFSSGRIRQANLRLSPPIINPQKKRQQLTCRPSGCQLSKNERVLRPVTVYS